MKQCNNPGRTCCSLGCIRRNCYPARSQFYRCELRGLRTFLHLHNPCTNLHTCIRHRTSILQHLIHNRPRNAFRRDRQYIPCCCPRRNDLWSIGSCSTRSHHRTRSRTGSNYPCKPTRTGMHCTPCRLSHTRGRMLEDFSRTRTVHHMPGLSCSSCL